MSYCTVKDTVLSSGMYENVLNESVGTGDASVKIFTLDNNKIVKESEKIYLGSDLQRRGSDYTINNDRGIVTFGSPPPDGKLITADYKKIIPEITGDDIENYITNADAEIDEYTGRNFTDGNIATDYFEGRAQTISASSVISSGQYFDETEEDKYLIILNNYPVQSITSLVFLKDDGTVDETLTENTDFQLTDASIGKIWLLTKKIPAGKNKKRVRVIYTHGYSVIPENIRQLSSVLAAIRMVTSVTGGSYVDMSSFSLGGVSVSTNEAVNLKTVMENLEKQKNYLLGVVGRETRMAVV